MRVLQKSMLMAIVAGLFCFTSSVRATALTWNLPGSGDWNDSASWTPVKTPIGTPPDNDTATFNKTTVYTITSTAATNSCANLIVSNTTGTPTFNFSGQTLNSTLSGVSIYGNANWTGGTCNYAGTILICLPGSDKTFDISNDAGTTVFNAVGNTAAQIGRTSGAAVANRNTLRIRGGASVTVAGTSNGVMQIGLANASAAADNNTCIVTGSGSTLSVRLFYVGNLGSATAGSEAKGNSLVVDDGGTATATTTTVGQRTVAGLTTCTDNKIIVGGTGTGSLFSSVGGLYIGPYAGNNTVTVNKGGTINATGTYISNFAGNKVIINGGTYNAINAMVDNNTTDLFVVGDNVDNTTPAVYHMVTGAHTFLAGVRVEAADGQLTGNGTLNANGAGVLINGVLAPDNGTTGPGTITFSDNGTITLGASSNSVFDIQVPSTAQDKVVASGDNVTLGGSLTVNGLSGVQQGTYTLITAGKISGNFANVTSTNLPAGSTVTPSVDNTTVKVTVTFPQAAAPAISPTGGTFITTPQTVTVTISGPAGAAIHYTTNGVDPTASDPTYTAPFQITVVSAPVTVKAIATATGYGNSSVTRADFMKASVATMSDVKEDFESYSVGTLRAQGQGWWQNGGNDTVQDLTRDAEILIGANGTKVCQTYTANNLYMQGTHGHWSFDNNTYTYPTGVVFTVLPARAYLAAQIRPRQYAGVVTPNQIGTQRYDGYPSFIIGVNTSDNASDPNKYNIGRFQFDDASYPPGSTRYSENVGMFDSKGVGYVFDIGVNLTLYSASDIRATLYYRNASLGGDWIKSSLDNFTFNNTYAISQNARTYIRGYMNGTELDNLRSGMGVILGDNLTISPNGATFSTPQVVTISGAAAGSTIHYSTNGNNPRVTDPVCTGSITLWKSCTLKAQAFLSDGFATSQMAQAGFTSNIPLAANPVITPAGGMWDPSSPISVTMTCSTSGAEIHYTTNGSDPDNTSPVYSGAVSVSAPATVKAVAVPPSDSGMYWSDVVTATYSAVTDFSYVESTTIPYGTATVDGNLADWAGASWVPLNVMYNPFPYTDPQLQAMQAEVPEAYYAARWTPTNIYVAVKVRDITHIFTDNYTGWNARDAIELYLHLAGSSTDGKYPNSDIAQQYTMGIKYSDRSAVWTTLGSLANNTVPSICNFQAAGHSDEVGGEWLYYEAAMTPFQYMGAFVSQPSVVLPLASGQYVGLDITVVANNGAYVGMLAENDWTSKSSYYPNILLHQLAGTVPTGIPGDVNNDGHVNAADLTIVLAAMDSKPGDGTWAAAADIDGDGEVTSGDLSIVLANME